MVMVSAVAWACWTFWALWAFHEIGRFFNEFTVRELDLSFFQADDYDFEGVANFHEIIGVIDIFPI